jgi:pilus assembly protein Flp/PilA
MEPGPSGALKGGCINPGQSMFKTFLRARSGATAIEYGLIAALIAVAIIGGVTTVGSKLSSTFASVAAGFQ